MNILHVTPAYYPATYWGGPIFSVYHLNNSLARLPGVSLRVITTDSAGPKRKDRVDVAHAKGLFTYDVRFTRRVAGACISGGLLWQLPWNIAWADVVHLTATYSFPTIPTLLLCHLYRKPLVWSLRGAILDDQNKDDFAPEGLTKRLLKRSWLKMCRALTPPDRVAIHVTTEQERKSALRVFPKARYVVVPNGVKIPETVSHSVGHNEGDGLRVLFMGRLAPKKGIENLLRAIAMLKMTVRCEICGTPTVGQGGKDYEGKLQELAHGLGLLNSKVFFKGHVSGEAKSRAFFEADVCVVPSYSENFCIVVAESLAHGTPVIVSDRLDWGGVADKRCGLVAPNDPGSLAGAMEKIKNMDLEAMGRSGREWMRKEYSWDELGKGMFYIYTDLARRGSADE